MDYLIFWCTSHHLGDVVVDRIVEVLTVDYLKCAEFILVELHQLQVNHVMQFIIECEHLGADWTSAVTVNHKRPLLVRYIFM